MTGASATAAVPAAGPQDPAAEAPGAAEPRASRPQGDAAASARAGAVCGSDAAEPPFFSIIVPVHNVEGYLDEALESACGQTFANIEILCVDDGSTDGSAAILARWAARDGRIRLFSQANRGVSAARNVGLDAARGEVVMFLDGDDRLDRRACERLRGVFDRERPDIVTFGARCFPDGAASRHLEECLSPRDALYEGFDEDILFKENSRPYMWRSAFSRRLLDAGGVRFPEGLPVGEDQVFYFSAYPRSAKTAFLSDKLYEYRAARGGSAMDAAGGDDLARVRDHVAVVEAIAGEWAEQGWFARYGWQALGWLAEFVALDLHSLPEPDRSELKARAGAALRRAVEGALPGAGGREDDAPDEDGEDGAGGAPARLSAALAKLPFRPATRAVLADLMGLEGAAPAGTATLLRFYLERRGIAACARRVLESVKGRLVG